MLGDERTYKKLDCDPALAVYGKEVLFLNLKKNGCDPDDLYCRLCSSGGLAPLILYEIHKPGVRCVP